MNSDQVRLFQEQAAQFGDVETESANLVAKSVASYLDALSLALGGRSWPESDLSNLSISLLLLSDATNEMSASQERRSLDYLTAMGFEQSGELLSRQIGREEARVSPPLKNDSWYRLTLSFLHYMAGGFRVQALCVLRHLQSLNDQIDSENRREYQVFADALSDYFDGTNRRTRNTSSAINDYLTGKIVPQEGLFAERRIYKLANRFREMKEAALEDLGLGNEANWLSHRQITSDESISFWKNYLERLKDRQYTNFTSDQIGKGFDTWLLSDKNLLVILPTGSGKTLIGELDTALCLSQSFQVIWMLPTRALVRQTKKELSDAFESLGVEVEELPVTEDYIPQQFDQINRQKMVAVTTPEKIAALIRSNKNAVSNVGLVVLDEAQILLENRGTIAEYALQDIRRLAPNCKFVLMSAFTDVEERLRNFLKRLVDNETTVVELISRNRPTRRVNGVITSYEDKKSNLKRPLLSIYPPKFFSELTKVEVPYKIFLDKVKLIDNPRGVEFAKKVSQTIIGTPLRGVVFVSTVSSAEKQAQAIAAKSKKNIQLPEYDVCRLRVELGRDSLVMSTAKKGVAPHHGLLSSLEQHIVEKWIKKEKIINLVIATPTLAQGVNLPFDLSIVSFLKRSRQENPSEREDVPIPEIMNMLGRAGRAGQVTDGLCLITAPKFYKDDVKVLNSSRKYFFRTSERNHNFLGLAKLLRTAIESEINKKDWLFEMPGMTLSQAQTLISFSLQSLLDLESGQTDLGSRLARFPSIQDLKEIFSEDEDVIKNLSDNINPLIDNLMEVGKNDTQLLHVVARTGLPIELLKFMVETLRVNEEQRGMSQSEIVKWSDEIVFGALEVCSDRDWFQRLFSDIKDFDLDKIRTLITLWRNGSSLSVIENKLGLDRSTVGKFLSRKVSLFAQFWGAVSVCDDELFSEDRKRPFEQIQMCVREGVGSLEELVWLNRLGGLDRVLAHRLARVTSIEMPLPDRKLISRFIKERLKRWKQKKELIPLELSSDEVGALNSIFSEM